MIQLPADVQSVLTRSYRYYSRVESWLGGVLLHDDVPFSAGNEETDRTLNVPERVTFTVPREKLGYSWAPDSDGHPLAANGQRLRVLLGVGVGASRVEWFQRGWFVISDSDAQGGDDVSVTAVGMLTLIDEAKLVSPYQPTGTLVSTLRGLVEPGLSVLFDAALVDRAAPAGINYDEDRLGAAYEVLESWPAAAYVTPEGYLLVKPTTVGTVPDLVLTDGTGGTVIRATGASSREGAYTHVVARGVAADGGQVQGVAEDTSAGPHSASGPFSPLPVPFYFFSPLLTTVDMCTAAANSVLQRKQRQTALEFEVQMVPHPGLQVGDLVSITAGAYTNLLCSVEYLSLPYKASGGTQTIRVRSVA